MSAVSDCLQLRSVEMARLALLQKAHASIDMLLSCDRSGQDHQQRRCGSPGSHLHLCVLVSSGSNVFLLLHLAKKYDLLEMLFEPFPV